MKLSNLPAQTGPYIVKVKNGAKWQDFRTARLQVSVGGPRHEGDKFRATIEWIRHRFDKSIFCVNDTLQRFNYMNNGISENEAYDLSLQAGNEWLSRHAEEIYSLPNAEIYRWEDWKGPNFIRQHKAVLDLYSHNQRFRDAIADGVKNKLSKNYLLEEVAVFSCMYQTHDAVDIYPGTLPKAMDIFKDQHTTRIDFSKRRAA